MGKRGRRGGHHHCYRSQRISVYSKDVLERAKKVNYVQRQVCHAARCVSQLMFLSCLREKTVPLSWRPQEDMPFMSTTKTQSEMVYAYCLTRVPTFC